MKVALVHDFLTSFGGAERVLKDLSDLYPQAPIFCLLYNSKKVPQFKNKKVIQSSLAKWPSFLKNREVLLRPSCPKAVEEFDLSKYDVVISNTTTFAKGAITSPHTIHISWIHSPTRYLWDYKDEYLEEHKVKGLKRMILSRLFLKMRLWDFEAAQRPDFLVANSKNVQKRIRKYYRRTSDIIYPGVDLSKYEVGSQKENFYLVVSRLSKYKKVDLAIRACNKLKSRLVIIGEGAELEHLKKIAGPTIEFKGFLPDKEVKEYYKRARAFLFPAEEDFGLTPIEAMASGTPVIAYRKGGLLETVNKGIGGLFFEDQSAKGLVETIKRFESQKDQFDPYKIAQSVKKFDISEFRKNFKEFNNNKYLYIKKRAANSRL